MDSNFSKYFKIYASYMSRINCHWARINRKIVVYGDDGEVVFTLYYSFGISPRGKFNYGAKYDIIHTKDTDFECQISSDSPKEIYQHEYRNIRSLTKEVINIENVVFANYFEKIKEGCEYITRHEESSIIFNNVQYDVKNFSTKFILPSDIDPSTFNGNHSMFYVFPSHVEIIEQVFPSIKRFKSVQWDTPAEFIDYLSIDGMLRDDLGITLGLTLKYTGLASIQCDKVLGGDGGGIRLSFEVSLKDISEDEQVIGSTSLNVNSIVYQKIYSGIMCDDTLLLDDCGINNHQIELLTALATSNEIMKLTSILEGIAVVDYGVTKEISVPLCDDFVVILRFSLYYRNDFDCFMTTFAFKV